MFKLQEEIIGAHLKTVQLNGSGFDNGRKIGADRKKYIRQIIRRDRKALDTVLKTKHPLIGYLRESLSKEYPEQIQEIEGMALGAEVDFQDLFLENCPEILNKEEGCTSAVLKLRSGTFLIHNEDEDGGRDEKGFAILNYVNDGFSRSAFAYPGELAGNAFGWNSAGMFYTVNYLATSKVNLNGIPRYFVARGLLEKKSLAEAVRYLRGMDEASGFHYFIGDANTGKIVSVEKSLRKISVIPVEESGFHSNHYIHPAFKELKKAAYPNSLSRLKTAKTAIKNTDDAKKVTKLFRSNLMRPLDKKDPNKTFATVVFSLSGVKLSK